MALGFSSLGVSEAGGAVPTQSKISAFAVSGFENAVLEVGAVLRTFGMNGSGRRDRQILSSQIWSAGWHARHLAVLSWIHCLRAAGRRSSCSSHVLAHARITGSGFGGGAVGGAGRARGTRAWRRRSRRHWMAPRALLSVPPQVSPSQSKSVQVNPSQSKSV